jgi:hypothetical protein
MVKILVLDREGQRQGGMIRLETAAEEAFTALASAP